MSNEMLAELLMAQKQNSKALTMLSTAMAALDYLHINNFDADSIEFVREIFIDLKEQLNE